MTLERDVQHAILKAWGSHPRLRIARVNTGAGYFNRAGPCRRKDPGARPVFFNPRGTADIVGLIAPAGQMLMVECKSDSGTSRPEQKVMRRVVTAMGGLYVIARTLADVDAALAPLGLYR